MEIGNIIPHIEALIFASDKPLTSMEITELVNNAFGFMEEKLTLEQIQTSIDGIREKYDSEFYPFEVRESGGGWQFLTKKDFHKTVAQLNGDKFLKRLSSAALETLSIIAYKQPITKGEIEAIRGVSSDYSIQKLLEKELIVISGRNENMPGKPLVYTTSKTFMDYFGINTADDLPKLKEVFAEVLIEPTLIQHSEDEMAPLQPNTAEGKGPETGADGALLLVSEDGELQVGTAGENAADEHAADESEIESEIPPYSDADESLAPEFPAAKADAAESNAAASNVAASNAEEADQSEESDEQPDEPDTSDDELAEAEIAEARLEAGSEGPDETEGESDEEGDPAENDSEEDAAAHP
jgi:segregation and condensation protein B